MILLLPLKRWSSFSCLKCACFIVRFWIWRSNLCSGLTLSIQATRSQCLGVLNVNTFCCFKACVCVCVCVDKSEDDTGRQTPCLLCWKGRFAAERLENGRFYIFVFFFPVRGQKDASSDTVWTATSSFFCFFSHFNCPRSVCLCRLNKCSPCFIVPVETVSVGWSGRGDHVCRCRTFLTLPPSRGADGKLTPVGM